MQAVPYWSVEVVRSQCSETGARRKKREETGGEKGKKIMNLQTILNQQIKAFFWQSLITKTSCLFYCFSGRT